MVQFLIALVITAPQVMLFKGIRVIYQVRDTR